MKNSINNILSHTLENCFIAKIELIKLGYAKESDFFINDDENHLGYLIGEPMLYSGDDYISALDSYNSMFDDGINMVDYYIENGLI